MVNNKPTTKTIISIITARIIEEARKKKSKEENDLDNILDYSLLDYSLLDYYRWSDRRRIYYDVRTASERDILLDRAYVVAMLY